MQITPTQLSDVLMIEPKVFADARGFFLESYNEHEFTRLTGITPHFVQDNHSRSSRNVLRGLHYQVQQVQAKLVRVIAGAIYDVAADVRRHSPTFGRWTAAELSAENRKMVWIPTGFAHGFLVTSEFAEVEYKVTDFWSPRFERCVLWNDPQLAIPWPTHGLPILSEKDMNGSPLSEAELVD